MNRFSTDGTRNARVLPVPAGEKGGKKDEEGGARLVEMLCDVTCFGAGKNVFPLKNGRHGRVLHNSHAVKTKNLFHCLGGRCAQAKSTEAAYGHERRIDTRGRSVGRSGSWHCEHRRHGGCRLHKWGAGAAAGALGVSV